MAAILSRPQCVNPNLQDYFSDSGETTGSTASEVIHSLFAK